MKGNRWLRGRHAGAVSVLLLSTSLALALCGTAAAAQPQMTASGSSLAGVAISQWEGQFNESDGGNINFSVTDSDIGLNEFANNTIDFAASDVTYPVSGVSAPTVPYQYVPDVGYALSFEYNLIGTNGVAIANLVLNPHLIAEIFTGAITSWSNPAIAKLNPSLLLPDESITAFYRSDPSAENYVLSEYGLHADHAVVKAFQQEASVPHPGKPSATWAVFPDGTPPALRGLVPVNGADAATEGPIHQPGGISFVAEPYARNANLPVASIVNKSGSAVQPTASGSAAALKGATVNADLSVNLLGAFDDARPTAYPLSAVSYLVVPCDPALAAGQHPASACTANNTVTSNLPATFGAELGQFIGYAVCLGQVSVSTLGYTPLPKNLVAEADRAIGRINGATQPPPPKHANCPNPELGNH
jgi:phosphate transport system substrate-binding protein